MSVQLIEGLQQYLQRLCNRDTPAEDAVLLNRFVMADDRNAFELLIARHGPMVLGTARRLVGNPHDADDVFQGVFLSLARLAKTIRHANTLPAWLHRTTCRIAAKVRGNRVLASQEAAPEPFESIDPSARLVWQEVCQALDEELEKLPDRLRSPLVLCYLSGLTRDEAASQLGWSLGTLKRRLHEGRNALRLRLERRGIGAVMLTLAVLAPENLQAAVSKSLLESSLRLIFSSESVVPATISTLVGSSANVTKGVAMKSIFALLAAVVVGVGIYAGTSPPAALKTKEAPKEAQPDGGEKVAQKDDPLPPGSILRFGTSRYRHSTQIETMTVSPDGKTAFAGSGTRINGSRRAIDLVTGRALFDVRGDAEALAISPDNRRLVIKQNLHLTVCDSRTGKSLRGIDLPKSVSRPTTDALTFTPDGRSIATISRNDVVHLIDFASGKTIRDFVHEKPEANSFPQVLAIAFSPDGKRMATGGYSKEKDNYFARLWDVETGRELLRFMHGKKGYGIRCLAFSPDGKTLATLGTQSGVFLRLFDVETGKLRRAFPKDGNQRARGGSVAFSPDGRTVAVACGSIHLYDVTTGKERVRIDRQASHLHFSDDGKTLTGAVSGAIYRWSTTNGRMLTPKAADSVVDQILVTPDGQRVVTRVQDGNGYLWDGATGKLLRRIPLAWQRGVAMSPDGRFLAWPVSDRSVRFTEPLHPGSTYYGSRLRLYEIVKDKVVDRFPAFKGAAQDLAFSNDGKRIVTIDQHGGLVRTWDFESGKQVRSFQILPDDLKEQSFFVRRVRLSPDGKTGVVTYEQSSGGLGVKIPTQIVRLWRVADGQQLLDLKHARPLDGAFSPDGRYVVTRGGNFVLEPATGQQVAKLPQELSPRAAAFSRDGRFLAIAVDPGMIQIWEVATWTKQNEFKGYQNRSVTLTFGPTGRLFTGNVDTTVLAWNVRPPHVAKSVSLESAWDDLAERNAGVSFQSQGMFFTSPSDTVKFLARKVRPAEALDPKRIHSLLADLDNRNFAVRNSASKALQELNEQVIPYLEEALKKVKSAEVRARVKKILERKRNIPITSNQLRQIRAVMILEQIGNGESKHLLTRWSRGAEGARLTMGASAAMKRLESALEAKR